MSIINRHRYDAFWLYDQARILDGDPEQEGATVRSGLEVLRTLGHVRPRSPAPRTNVRSERNRPPDKAHGIKTYRWAASIDQVFSALGTPDAEFAVLLNSWGEAFPHRTRISRANLEKLLGQAGEAAIVTDL